MTYAQRALYLALVGDTRTATLAAGSTTTVLQLTPGGAAAWSMDDWLHVASVGEVARVVEVDTDLDTLTLDRPLTTAPATGVTIGAGFVQWARPVIGGQPFAEDRLYHVDRGDLHPAVGLLAQETDPRCVVLYGPIASTRQAFTAILERWRFRIFSREGAWADACTARIRTLLDGRRSALTIPGRDVYQLEALDALPSLRDDELVERQLQVAAITSRKAAA